MPREPPPPTRPVRMGDPPLVDTVPIVRIRHWRRRLLTKPDRTCHRWWRSGWLKLMDIWQRANAAPSVRPQCASQLYLNCGRVYELGNEKLTLFALRLVRLSSSLKPPPMYLTMLQCFRCCCEIVWSNECGRNDRNVAGRRGSVGARSSWT